MVSLQVNFQPQLKKHAGYGLLPKKLYSSTLLVFFTVGMILLGLVPRTFYVNASVT
jgi:hypothetical protein